MWRFWIFFLYFLCTQAKFFTSGANFTRNPAFLPLTALLAVWIHIGTSEIYLNIYLALSSAAAVLDERLSFIRHSVWLPNFRKKKNKWLLFRKCHLLPFFFSNKFLGVAPLVSGVFSQALTNFDYRNRCLFELSGRFVWLLINSEHSGNGI